MTYSEVASIFTEANCKLLKYTKVKAPVTYIASCGHENTLSDLRSFKKSNKLCKSCNALQKTPKYSWNDIQEIAKTKGCTLVSYKDTVSPITIVASCGHETTVSCLSALIKGSGLCRSCAGVKTSTNKKDLKDVVALFESKGCSIISYSGAKKPITYTASCGHETVVSNLVVFTKSENTLCKDCITKENAKLKIKPKEYMEELCVSRSCTLVSYTSMEHPMTYIAPCGHLASLDKAYYFKSRKNLNCSECNPLQRVPNSVLQNLVEANGCKFVRVEGKTIKNIRIVPKCGHEEKVVTINSVKLGHSTLCARCSSSSSKGEQEVIDFLKEHTEVKERQKILDGKYEIDAYLPEYKLGIEYNGIFWHSEGNGKTKNYHLNKTKMASNKGIQLLHVFENEWVLKKDIIKSILLNKLGKSDKLYARKTKVINVTASDAKDFLSKNHRQGSVNGTIRLGLEYEGTLVSLMVFGKSRFGSQEYELLRFCNLLNTSVIGGASKLLKYFEKTVTVSSLVSYADLRYSDGSLYNTLGFTLKHNATPNYWYFKQNSLVLESRVKYQKHKLRKLLSTFNNNDTEYKNMLNNGYNRIWDCGNAVYIKTYKE